LFEGLDGNHSSVKGRDWSVMSLNDDLQNLRADVGDVDEAVLLGDVRMRRNMVDGVWSQTYLIAAGAAG
jgi:hypothetical protein